MLGDPHRRFYAVAPPPWDGRWLLLFAGLGGIEAKKRAALKRELQWLGFGVLGGGVYAHPRPDHAVLDRMLKRRTFQSIRSLSEAIAELKGEPAAAEGHLPEAESTRQLRGVA